MTFKQTIPIKDFLAELIDDILLPSLQIIIKSNLFYSLKAIAPLFKKLVSVAFMYASCSNDSIISNFAKLLILIENNRKVTKLINYSELKLNTPEILNSKIK